MLHKEMEPPRETNNHAAHHRLTMEQLQSIDPEFKIDLDPNEDVDYGLLSLIGYSLPHYFRTQGITLHLGDVITLIPFIQTFNDWAHYIFDGEKIKCLELDGDYWDPSDDFECITQFPIHYWDGIIETTSVKFRFSHHEENAIPDAVVRIGKIFYYPFTYKGITYRFVSDYDTRQRLTTVGFLRHLMDMTSLHHTAMYPSTLIDPLLMPSDRVVYCRILDTNEYSNDDPWGADDMGPSDKLD